MATEASGWTSQAPLLHYVVQVESELGGVETINQNSFSHRVTTGENIYILQEELAMQTICLT